MQLLPSGRVNFSSRKKPPGIEKTLPLLTKWLNLMVNVQEDTEARILSAATHVFRTKGRDGARMQDIANEAGINKALLHYYFRSKDLLFERVFRDSTTAYFARLNEILRAEDDLFTKIRQLCKAYITQSMENPFIAVFILGEVHRNPEGFLRKMFTSTGNRPDYNLIRQQIRKEVRSGNIRNVSAEQLMMNILSLSIFPTIARPMMQEIMGMDDAAFREAMEERIRTIPELVIGSIKRNTT